MPWTDAAPKRRRTAQTAGSGRGEVKLWHVATGKELATLKGHAGEVLSVRFSNDGKLLATGGAGGMKLWDLAPDK